MKPAVAPLACSALLLLIVFGSTAAHAVPSFSRQTDQACSSCHTVPPELTAHGREFKLKAYSLGWKKKSGDEQKDYLQAPGLAVEIGASFTSLAEEELGFVTESVEFPQELKLFMAGAISSNAGMYSSVEYGQEADHFSIGLTDIRFAGEGRIGNNDLIYGLTINNSPTVEDPWNTLNVWAYPHRGPTVVPTPAARTLLGGELTRPGVVGGIGGYALIEGEWYFAGALYRSSVTGEAQPALKQNLGFVRGAVPYARFAWQRAFDQGDFQIGASMLSAKYDGGRSGQGTFPLTDAYRDIGIDAQWAQPIGKDSLAVHASYISEKQTLDSSSAAGLSNPTNTLKTLRLDTRYSMPVGWAFSLGYFNTTGSRDTLLYQPDLTIGSASGKPDTTGFVVQSTYLPWSTVQLMLQFTAYNKFNGGSTNYDGAGRDAADNNTTFLLLMFDL